MADIQVSQRTMHRAPGFVLKVGLEAGQRLGQAISSIPQASTALGLSVPEGKKVVAEVTVRLKVVDELPPNLPAFRQI